MGVEPKIGGKTPEMDGENNEKPYEQMDDLGGNTPIFRNIHIDQHLYGQVSYNSIYSSQT